MHVLLKPYYFNTVTSKEVSGCSLLPFHFIQLRIIITSGLEIMSEACIYMTPPPPPPPPLTTLDYVHGSKFFQLLCRLLLIRSYVICSITLLLIGRGGGVVVVVEIENLCAKFGKKETLGEVLVKNSPVISVVRQYTTCAVPTPNFISNKVISYFDVLGLINTGLMTLVGKEHGTLVVLKNCICQ